MTKEEILELGIKKKKGEIDKSYNQLVVDYNLPFKNGDCFRKYISRHMDIRQKSTSSQLVNNNKVTTEIKNDGTQVSDKLIEMSEYNSKNPEYLLKAHGYDSNLFELISARNSIWNSGDKELYSSRIAVKPKQIPDLSIQKINKIFNSLKVSKKHNLIQYENLENRKKALFVNIADLHLGLQSYLETSGNIYNNKIAIERCMYVVNDIVQRINKDDIEQIFLLSLGDLINYDVNYSTTKGTPQIDHDGTYYRTFEDACKLIIDIVEAFRSIAPVSVIGVNGNHDQKMSYSIFKMIEAWYHNDENITVYPTTLDRNYFKYGDTLIGVAHDVEEKLAFKIMVNEAKSEITSCQYMYWFLGHLHKSMMVDDDSGLELRRLPTISGRSDWTNSKGYTGTHQKTDSFIVDKEYGITDVLTSVIQ